MYGIQKTVNIRRLKAARQSLAAYATHLMRRTKPTLIYRRTKNLRKVQLLFGHSKVESAVR